MKDSQKYLLIGVFIVISISVLIGVWLWFSSSNRKAYDTYLAIFHEPIDGVTTSSVVKYNGVEVGKVRQIKLGPKNPNNIFVYINVLAGTPIATITYATIKPQGITGMSYIDLRLKEMHLSYQIIEPRSQEPYPEIQTKPSLLYSLSEQAQSVTNNVKDISAQTKLLLDNKNIDHVANIVANLDKISLSISSRSEQVSQSIDSLNSILANVKNNSEQVTKIVRDVSTLTQNLNNMVTVMQNTTLQNVNNTLLPNVNQVMENMSRSSIQLEELLKMLNQNPSALVRGKADKIKGPGE